MRAMLVVMGILIGASIAGATTYVVAPSGGDFTTIQAALDVAIAGDTILVKDNPSAYHEKLAFPRNGNASAGPITLRAYPGHHPIVDGTGVTGANMMLLHNRSYVSVIGFEIRNNSNVNDGSGIRITGSGAFLELRDNVIHDMRGVGAMGITVYGTSASASISDLIIAGNQIHDCEPADSEALVLNGNVERFAVTGNVVRDVNNVGIDFIGGEADINPSFVARNGVCAGNLVERANANYGGGFAAGIYVDGGKDIVVRGNVVTQSDLGIEIGAENAGIVVTGVVVRDNVLYGNLQAGLVFGGYDSTAGRVNSCQFLGNTCFKNDTTGQFLGELWINWASDNVVHDNIFYSTAQNVLLYSENGNVNNALDFNTWYAEAGAGNAEFGVAQLAVHGVRRLPRGQRPGWPLAVRGSEVRRLRDGELRAAVGVTRDRCGQSRRSARVDRHRGQPALPRRPLDRCHGDRLRRVRVRPCPPRGKRICYAGRRAADRRHRDRGAQELPVGGHATGRDRVPPVRCAVVRAGAPWIVTPWGTIPSSTQVTLPPSLPPGLAIITQILGVAAPAGNTSNAVTIVVH
ncbi:MAG: right-handed parallel beta-helix repeat-containing protein [Planctomycetota bacterium]